MDVERVQKINSLAMELVNQGLARDKEEAVKQAEGILAKKDYSSLNETVKETGDVSLDAAKGAGNEAEEELSQEKVKEILEKNTVFIVGKMREFQEQMEGLKGEVNNLRNEVMKVRSKLGNLETRSDLKPGRGEARNEVPQPQQNLEGGSGREIHPRSGDYVEDEVSIEKFFYSGSKSKN